MNSDLVSMIGNVSRSLYSVESLIAGLGYLIGIFFVIIALSKLKHHTHSSSQEGMFEPIAYFFGGAALIFLPSMLRTLSNTVFGSGNVLQYIQYNPYSIYNSMGMVIQTAGVIWFVRGCVLLVHGSAPGAQHGTKGLAFIVAGIFATNFEYSVGIVNYCMNHLMLLTGMGQPGA